jgi:hypothetical protein
MLDFHKPHCSQFSGFANFQLKPPTHPTMFIKNISLTMLALGASMAFATNTPSLRVSNLFGVTKIHFRSC